MLKSLTESVVFQVSDDLRTRLQNLANAQRTSLSRIIRGLLWDRYDHHSHHPIILQDELKLVLTVGSPPSVEAEALIKEPMVVRTTRQMSEWLEDTAALMQTPVSRLVRSLLWEAQAYNEADGRLKAYLEKLDIRDTMAALDTGEARS